MKLSGGKKGKDLRFLVSRTDRIGDLVLSLPVVHTLKLAYPHARVDFLVHAETAAVVSGQPEVDDVLVFDPAEEDMRRLVAELSARDYTAVICLYPRPKLARSFARAGIPIRIGTSRRWYSFYFTHRVKSSRRSSGRHEKDLNLDLLQPLGITPDYRLAPKLVPPQCAVPLPPAVELLARLKGDGQPVIVVHPGDGGSAVNWKMERYAQLVESLHQEDISVVVTGMASEREKHLATFSGILGELCILSGKTQLEQLLAVLSQVDLFIGGSTGPLHLAAAVGTPVVGLYGPIYSTTPDRWGPCGPGHRVFTPEVEVCRCKVGRCRRGDCMDRIAVTDVFTAAQQMLRSNEIDLNQPTNKTPPVSDPRPREGLCP